MKKLLLLLLSLLIYSNAYCANEWRHALGENTILGTENASDIDSASYEDIVAPLDRLLSNYKNTVRLVYNSASQITVEAGEIVCSNSDGSIRRFRKNTTSTTVTWANIDTGSEAVSTTYYVYAIADADAETFTCKISLSSTAPDSSTYYKRLGSFYNNSSGDINTISNDSFQNRVYDSGWFAVTYNNTYSKTHNLGTTKVNATIMFSTASDGSGVCIIPGGVDLNGASEYGVYTSALTNTTVTVDTGYSSCSAYDGAPGSYLSGYARIILIALE